MLSSQIYSTNKCGLGFSHFDKRSTSQTIFVNATREFNHKESIKLLVVDHHKMPYDRNNFYVVK